MLRKLPASPCERCGKTSSKCGCNAIRAKLADRALRLMDEPYDPDSALCDLLTDLMHWAEAKKVDFDSALWSAERHFDCERIGQAA